MEIIKLSPRLRRIASLIPEMSSVADIGTDHGHIPVWLAQCGKYGALAATDIRMGPLQNARRNAEAYGVDTRIRFVQCSGLDFPGSDAYQTVIIAGMGGELIASILNNAPWTKSGTRLILQPNSKVDVLNIWLALNGYGITDVHLVKDAGKIYQILVSSGKDDMIAYTPVQRLVHPLYITKHDPLLGEYLDILIRKYSTAIAGMEQSRRQTDELQQEMALLYELKQLRKETETWQP